MLHQETALSRAGKTWTILIVESAAPRSADIRQSIAEQGIWIQYQALNNGLNGDLVETKRKVDSTQAAGFVFRQSSKSGIPDAGIIFSIRCVYWQTEL